MYAQSSYQSNSYNAGASSSSSSGPRTRQGSPYQQPPTPPSAPDVRGRHRKRAELQRLNHEIQILQSELWQPGSGVNPPRGFYALFFPQQTVTRPLCCISGHQVEELSELDKVPPASKACKELVEFVNNCPDPFLSNSEEVGPAQGPYDRPVKSSYCCWNS